MPDLDSPVATLDSGTSRGDSVITVYFVPNGDQANFTKLLQDPSSEMTSDGWTRHEIDRVMAALATISNYINITFEQSTNPNSDFQMVLDDDEFTSEGALGYFYLPATTNYTGQQMGVFNANGYGWNDAGLMPGGTGFATIIHEALHGLGLDHPFDTGAYGNSAILDGLDPTQPDFPFGYYGDFGLNQTVYTIMTYNSGYFENPSNSFDYGDAMGPMALDVAMLQKLYGANTTYNNGNDIYVLPDANVANNATGWLTIWDTGGIDTITYGGSRNVTIDLRPATLRYEDGGGGFISAAEGIAGGYTIANGVIIENATGGSGNDLLIGNDAANTLVGNAGSDTIITSSGTNMIYGSSGADTITGGNGADTIFGNSGNDTINGGGGHDTLFGGRGDDVLNGGDGDDILNGGMGQDMLTGGAGADTFVFDFVSDSWASRPDTITDFVSGTDRIDLSGIDADLSTAENDALSFGNSGDLTDTSGSIWIDRNGSDSFVHVDRDGDGIAEMAILLTGVETLDISDFIL